MPAPSDYIQSYKQSSDVYLESGTDKFTVLDTVLNQSGFFDRLEAVFQAGDLPQAEFSIAIKPNLMTASIREDPSPVYTDPELVEYLIGHLRDKGFRKISLVESHNVYDYSYQNRSVPAVADMVGYTGDGYDILDLTDEPVPWDYGGVLGEHVVGKTWRDADFRISFAKNKTHWQCFYTGCLKNIYGCLPVWDKMKYYHGINREFYQCTILMADNFPVHFGLLDAWVSGDGFSGHVRDTNPNHTHTLIASDNIYALDWVMGEKMALDPMENVVIQEAYDTWGGISITRHGDMTPWKPWVNIRPLTVKMLDILEERYWISRIFSRAFASHQDPRFPPVSRWQWFFGIFQRLTRFFEGGFVSKS